MIRKFLTHLLGWTRVHPTLFDSCWYVFVAIRKFLEESVTEYREKKWNLPLQVLDFWCWNQPYRYIFSGDAYYWCDIGNSPEHNDKITTILEWAQLPYWDNQFDIILCTEVLEHVKYPELFAGEFKRVLKTDWLLLITVPQIWNYHPYPQHFFNYTPDGLDLFLGNKFSSRELFSDTSPFQTWIMISMMYSDCKSLIIKAFYTFFTNLLFLTFPKYRIYNHASTHVFARYIK